MTARHDAVSVLTDAERWSSSPQAPFDPVLLGADPPIHSEMRSIVDDALGSAVRDLGSSGVSEIVREVLTTAFAHQTSEGSIDAVRDIASPISQLTLARVLGFPSSRLDELAQWSALHTGAPFDAEQARAGREQALKRLNAAIQGDVRDSTFIGHLGHSVFSGTITKAEAFRMCDTVVVGGLETTTVLLTTILELQAEHEDADPIACLRKGTPPVRG